MNEAARCQLKVGDFVVLLLATSLPLISGCTTKDVAATFTAVQSQFRPSATPNPLLKHNGAEPLLAGLRLDLVAPSETLADPNAPVSTALTGCEHDIPSGMAPAIGEKIYAKGIFYLPNIRIVAFDGNKVLGEASGHRPGMPETGIMGDLLASYTGQNLKFRAELSVDGKWTPVSAPVTIQSYGNKIFSYGNKTTPRWDFMVLVFGSIGSDQKNPTASNVVIDVVLWWVAPNVVVGVRANHKSANLLVYQQANNYASESVTLNGQPYPAKTISVKMTYDGNRTQGNPFTPGGPDISADGPQPAHSPIPGVSLFPYGGPLTDTKHNTDKAEVSDSLTSGGFPAAPGVTAGFTAEGAALLMDGREYYGQVHSQ